MDTGGILTRFQRDLALERPAAGKFLALVERCAPDVLDECPPGAVQALSDLYCRFMDHDVRPTRADVLRQVKRRSC